MKRGFLVCCLVAFALALPPTALAATDVEPMLETLFDSDEKSDSALYRTFGVYRGEQAVYSYVVWDDRSTPVTCKVSWSDGTRSTAPAQARNSGDTPPRPSVPHEYLCTLRHTYADGGIYTVAADAIDKAGNSGFFSDDDEWDPLTLDHLSHVVYACRNAVPAAGVPVNGTGGPNVLCGGPNNDVVNAGDGNDFVIMKGGGSDAVDAGPGNDKVAAFGGSQLVHGGGGDDELGGGRGDDTLNGEGGADDVAGDQGNDVQTGGPGQDWVGEVSRWQFMLWANRPWPESDDRMYGNGGADTVIGEGGSDRLYGGGGPDTVAGEDGENLVSGGPDDDLLFGGFSHDIVRGGDGNDIIYGDAEGGYGSEHTGKGVADDLFGDAGDDSMFGGPGRDHLEGGAHRDRVNGGGGRDEVLGGTGPDKVAGNAGIDVIRGEQGNDLLRACDDTLDYLIGGDGEDRANHDRGDDLSSVESRRRC